MSAHAQAGMPALRLRHFWGWRLGGFLQQATEQHSDVSPCIGRDAGLETGVLGF